MTNRLWQFFWSVSRKRIEVKALERGQTTKQVIHGIAYNKRHCLQEPGAIDFERLNGEAWTESCSSFHCERSVLNCEVSPFTISVLPKMEARGLEI